jgi:hypothetical protein
MSCCYRALPRLIPQLMLLAKPGSEIVVVSPWIDNVTLHPPMFDEVRLSAIRLGDLMAKLAVAHEIHFTLLFRDHDHRLDRAVDLVRARTPSLLTLRPVLDLHAKMIAIDGFVLEMSANLIRTSLYRNVESCSLLLNSFGDAGRYVEYKLLLTV